LRIVPRWVHVWAIGTVALTFVLLALGGFVTSFRVGMADPVWPTEPWYLLSNKNWEFGFVVEHTHRVAAYLVGFATSMLALAVWWREPNKNLRRAGLAAIVALLAAFGAFNMQMRSVWENLQTAARDTYNIDAKSPNFEATFMESRLAEKASWPVLSGTLTAVLAIGVIACGVMAGLSGAFGGWLRCLALASLVAVMAQGLLGGLRVFFNALAGTNLAAIHGAFGQLTCCALVAVAVLASTRRGDDTLSDRDRDFLVKPTWFLAFLLCMQLLFAVMLRHGGSGLSQRLHVLTAFAVTGVVVWLRAQILSRPGSNFLLANWCYLALGLLVLQLALGVEAYLGKFAALGAQAQWPPELRPVSGSQAMIRTTHQLTGGALLAVAVAMAILAGRLPAVQVYQSVLQEKEVPPVAAMAFDAATESRAESRPPQVALMATKPPPDDGLVR
jgi:heme A synthase